MLLKYRKYDYKKSTRPLPTRPHCEDYKANLTKYNFHFVEYHEVRKL